MKSAKNIKGFSLIELMVSLSIMTLLMSVAAPYFTAWLANMRVKNVAESVNLGIIQARAEAIRRNEIVFFILNSDTSWEIKTQDDDLINKKDSRESGEGISIAVEPANASIISFNGMGSISSNKDGSETIEQVVVDSVENFEGVIPLTLRVWPGGGSLVCAGNCDGRNIN